MLTIHKLTAKLRALFGKRKLDAEMDEEMRSHIQLRTDANLEAGMDAEAARFAALREFGRADSIKEICRDQRGVGFIEHLVKDVRFGVRQLTKSPGFTMTAIMVLALGIGANTTVFSIINSILVKPVRISHPEQIVGVYQHDRDQPGEFKLFSYLDFTDLRSAQAAAFTDLFAFRFTSVGVQGDLADKAGADFVSANYFPALGVAPALGRVFLPEEETSAAPVVVLTDAYWRRLGADPAVVGRKLKLTRGEVTVVGVMPRGFTGAEMLAPAMFLPLGIAPYLTPNPGQSTSRMLTDRGDHSLMIMGRLKAGWTLASAEGALAALNQQFAVPDPAEPKARTLICTPPSRFNFSAQPSGPIRGLVALGGFAFGLSMLVLIIACLNLANMMLARGAARQKEIAIRLALGAGRRRILRQLLTEGFLLALLGGVASLLISLWATNILATFIYSGAGMPPDFPKFDLSPDWRVLAMLVLLSGVATKFFALVPAWKLARLDFQSDLKRNAGEDAVHGRRGRFHARELLVAGQMALTLALLVTAVLFTRSAINAAGANPGFEFGSNFYLALDTSLVEFPEPRVRDLMRNATSRLSALPGVESVSPAMNIPFGDSRWNRGVQAAGAPQPNSAASAVAGKELTATYNVVGAGYFHTLGLPLRRGREFERRETEGPGAPPVAIISQNLASQLWPGQEALGRSIQFPGYRPGIPPTVMTIVGIAPEVHWELFDKARPAEVYVPFGQDFQANLKLHVRVAPGFDPEKLMTAAREELRRLDARMPVTEVKTLAALHRDGPVVRVTRLGSILFGAFGGLAVLLSLLGVYGLKAYAVARRTREIGIRMALGARRRDVTNMVLRESTWLAVLGIGLGIVLALTVGRFAAQYLCKVQALDAATFLILPPLLLAAMLLACWVPARRAAKVDPMTALRHD